MFWFIDVLGAVFILGLGYYGYSKGFIEELGRLIGLILAILISISHTTKLSIVLNNILTIDHWLSIFISFVFLFIGTLLVARLITKMFHIALLSNSNQLMNQSLGLIFGVIKGFFIIIVFLWFISLLPINKWKVIIKENSRLATISTEFRTSLISFFHWDDPIALGEAYIIELTQP